ncbi:ATP-grasp domain-containing protein [Nitritalea halalkaliphila]|uniref:ATP-grasp domain-containing protein n=1 Tax=Nitritalea halalkaliphila TaxID=590849 RepID=UPI001EE67A3E|nr:ATP-grasp domain-containing protein [Nitritalea halalkaliphila]
MDSPEHWQEVLPALKAQLLATQDMYPGEVVNTQQFLIESYIRGEEYAIDCYLDAAGEPVILNIMHHWFTSEADVSDRVYCASLGTWKRLHEPVLAFLKVLAQVTGLKNFPLHLEVRQQEDGRIIPIEVNPMRFGGFCTTADVAHFAFGLNAYEAFMQEQRPDIEAMMQAKPDALFALVLLDNTSGIPADEIAGFNFPALERDLTGILHVRKLPFITYGVFGFVFTETPLEKRHELEQLLHSDLKKYVVRKDAVTRPTPC